MRDNMLNLLVSRISPVSIVIVFFSYFLFAAQSLAATDKTVYLRTGAGVSWSRDANFSDSDCQSSSPAAFFGCSNGNDGKAIGAYGDFGNSVVLDLGFGYLWNDWLRTELSFSYRPSLEFEGKSNFNQINPGFNQSVRADLKSFSGMLVGVVKPLALLGRKKWRIEPLIKAGLGVAHNSIDSMEYTFPLTATSTPGGDHTGFAWMTGAGFAYKLTDTVELELMYRYSDLGEVNTDVDTMKISRRANNSIINDSIVINKIQSELEVHEILINVIWFFSP